MDRFKNILLTASPGHLEPATLRTAIKLAARNDSQLTVMDVSPKLPRWHRKVDVEGRTVDVESALLRDREERLRRMVDLAKAPPATKVVVTRGEAFIEVISHVLVHDIDLVMVGEHAVEKGSAPPLQSGVMHLLRKCPVPVWVMRPSQARTLRILALIDPDPGDPTRDGLNDLVLDLASSMAQREDGDLHVGHAWHLSGEATLRSSPFVSLPVELVDVMVEETRHAHRVQLDALVERHHLSDLDCEVHLVSGEAREVLPKLAHRLGTGLIVMGTVARTGVSGLIMGNTAESILRSVPCSVLAVKPKGFSTPVKRRRRHG